MSTIRFRSAVLDRVRGAAMLLVILGHTMIGCTVGAQNSFMYRVIWSLQMPLFFLLSGYLTRYAKPLPNARALLRQLARRSLQLLFPFGVWSFLIRGLLFGQRSFLNLAWLARHMDSGYWFLFSLWVISAAYLLASFLGGKVIWKRPQIAVTLFFGLLLAILGLVALWQGVEFLGAKLSLYYASFYFLGVLVGRAGDRLPSSGPGRTLVFAVSFVGWILFLLKCDFFSATDSVRSIALRWVSSVLGCSAVFLAALELKRWRSDPLPRRVLRWIGTHTLELYLVHYLCLNLIREAPAPDCESLSGATLILLNFCLTLGISAFVTLLFSRTRFLRFLLYGKTDKR